MYTLHAQIVDDKSESKWASKSPDPNIPISSLRVASSSAGMQEGRKLVVIRKEHDSHGQRAYGVLWLGDEDIAHVSAKFLETSTHPL